MKTAKELFEELGYELHLESNVEIVYRYKSKDKRITTSSSFRKCYWNKSNGRSTLYKGIRKAIR